MRSQRVTWRGVLGRHGSLFLRILIRDRSLEALLSSVANRLVSFLTTTINTCEDAASFWRVIPLVLSSCDDQATYSRPMAVEAYSWLHLLDRYVRTWRALTGLVRKRYLPLGKDGVNVLDIGTGPGPSTLAISDFYGALSTFSRFINEPLLEQECRITSVELASENNAFRSRFQECTLGTPIEVALLSDIAKCRPVLERARAYNSLLQQDSYNPEVGEYEPLFNPYLANLETQGLFRYRLITLSNFLTNRAILGDTRESLSETFSDLRPGAVVLVIGGCGSHYPQIYQFLDELAKNSGLSLKLAGFKVAAEEREQRIILEAARRVAAHVQDLCPMLAEVPESVRRALRGDEPWGGISSVRAYRRDRLPPA